MANAVFPTYFQSGPRLIDGTDLNNALNNLLDSTQDAITANAGGGQTNAFLLNAGTNRVTVVVSAGDSVKLPPAIAGNVTTIINDSTSGFPLQVFGSGTDTVNDVATATGISQPFGFAVDYYCTVAGKWYANGLGVSAVQGTVTLNGATPVAVATTAFTTNSGVILTWKTLGGSQGAQPIVSSRTAGTGFSVQGTAGDTSIYIWQLIS